MLPDIIIGPFLGKQSFDQSLLEITTFIVDAGIQTNHIKKTTLKLGYFNMNAGF